MQIIDGKALAKQIREKVKEEIKTLDQIPGLAVILVGADAPSHIYVAKKEQACVEAGIHFEKYLYFHTEPESKIIERIKTLNERDDIHAILVQLPLPFQFDRDKVIQTIDPKKDVDGFHPKNIKLLIEGNPNIISPIHSGITALIESTDINFKDKECLIIANSETFSSPLISILESRGTKCSTLLAPFDKIDAKIKKADIVVSAIGKPQFILGDWFKDNAVIIDAGTNHLEEGGVIGDVDFESTKEKNGFITPVPGGVGPMTIAMLLENVVKLSK
jgi:methylenetetrahydrofolate dehydrogenase (NADP+)/methenyltetrahydrofolate cyclohydrolase